MLVSTLSLLGAMLPLAACARDCPLLGADFLPPRNLITSPTFQAALANLNQTLNQAISIGNSSYGPSNLSNTSFSIEIFSIHDSLPLFTRHHDSANLGTTTQGTKNITSNTTYRIGSLTKLFTVYTFLLNAGDSHFNSPITSYIPELAVAAQLLNATENSLDYVAWEDITLGELASQTAGIGRDYSGFGELEATGVTSPTYGLPVLNASEVAICAGGAGCNRTRFFEGFTRRHPVYAPGTAAVYSNAAFQILAYALENITGVGFQTLIQDSLFSPLELSNGTSWKLPVDNSTSIIPKGSAYALDLGDETPAGGLYSTLTDVVKMGRSILTSSLLRPALTRRWLKPHAFTSDPTQGVGAPWEIRRLSLPPNNRLVDIYSKAGDLPGYSSLMGLIPDWDVGFVILSAAEDGATDAATVIADIVSDVMLSAVELAAREEAEAGILGRYESVDGSSIVLDTDVSRPGFGIVSWVSGINNTDMLATGLTSPGQSNVRLYPTGLKREMGNGDVVWAYRATLENLEEKLKVGGLWTGRCDQWEDVDGTMWGGVGLDEFLITVGADGEGKSVTSRALRVEMSKAATE